jgi:hypothetical protein
VTATTEVPREALAKSMFSFLVYLFLFIICKKKESMYLLTNSISQLGLLEVVVVSLGKSSVCHFSFSI